jgi:glycosyltransferase involved in cell wall biosynthesis
MSAGNGKKINILWVGDGVTPTGFSRVNHNIIKHLDEKYEVHHLAINYRGDPHEYNHRIYPAAVPTGIHGDVWGYSRFINLIVATQPKIIFILNDPWVIQQYLALMIEAKGRVPNIENIPVVVYFPVDATEHDAHWFRDYNELVKKVCVYSEFGKKVILETGAINPATLKVVPHGTDKDIFFPLKDIKNKQGDVIKTGMQIARESILPITQKPELLNSFIVLNANRNQPRKRIDITLKAFGEFAKDKPRNVKLYLHMGTQDMGWDIVRLAVRYSFDERLVITSNNPSLSWVSDEKLNMIYNACDVGLNTSMGEGWGLCSWEHAAAGRPQIVGDHSVSRELWGDDAIYIPTIADHLYEVTHTCGRIVSVEGTVEALETAYQDWLKDGAMLRKMGKNSLKLVRQSKYDWKNVSKQFEKVFEEVNVDYVAN